MSAPSGDIWRTPEARTRRGHERRVGRVRGRPEPPSLDTGSYSVPPPAPRGLLVDPCGGKRRKGARGPETRVAAPPGPHDHPWDRGRRAADPARRAPPPRLPPRLPGHRPSPEGRAPPAVDGEEAGTEEAGRRAGTRALPPPLLHARGRREAGREEDGRTAPDAHAPPGHRARARTHGQTLVSRADFQ